MKKYITTMTEMKIANKHKYIIGKKIKEVTLLTPEVLKVEKTDDYILVTCKVLGEGTMKHKFKKDDPFYDEVCKMA